MMSYEHRNGPSDLHIYKNAGGAFQGNDSTEFIYA